MALQMSQLQKLFQLKLPILHETIQNINPLYPLLLVLSIFGLYLNLIIKGEKNKPNLPPSPPKLPVIGNLHQLGKVPHRAITALSRKYGPIMLMKMGQAETLVISSEEFAKKMMKTHDVVFSNRPQTVAAKIFFYGCKDVGFAPYGEYWRQVKKLCVLELLSAKRVQMFQYVREEELQLLVNRLKRASFDGLCVNLTDMLISTSNNLLSRCMLGKKFEDENGRSTYGELTRRVIIEFTSFAFADFFPSLSWIDGLTGVVRKFKRTRQEFDVFFDQLIEERKKIQDSQPEKKDLLDILLQLQKDDNLDFELTNDHIKALILDLLLAGTDTSSSSIEWTVAELIKNPPKMKKAQEEIRRVLGKNAEIDLNNLNQMEYLECVIKESLRLHPPGLLIPRELSTGIKDMGGYEIPSKTRVYVNAYAIHRDPSLWEYPDDFIPERFMEKPLDFRGQEYFQYLPFGGGRRGCPGLTFAVAAVKHVMASLLYWFDWDLPDKCLKAEDLNMDESPGLTASKRDPILLKPISYTP